MADDGLVADFLLRAGNGSIVVVVRELKFKHKLYRRSHPVLSRMSWKRCEIPQKKCSEPGKIVSMFKDSEAILMTLLKLPSRAKTVPVLLSRQFNEEE